MTPPRPSGRRCLAAILLAAATSAGCASTNPHGTHEGELLDNKVTAERVHAALRRAGPEFSHVKVTASREAITLTGTVSSKEALARAEEIAKEVNGGAKLVDRVSVR